MVLGFLKSEKANISVSVDKPGLPYYAGETIHATVALETETEVKVRSVSVALVAWEKYQYRERDNEGDISSVWTTAEDALLTETLVDEGTIPARFRQTYRVDFRIPLDIAPPYTGKITQNRWLIKAVMNRPMKKDISAEVEIPIIVPPPETSQSGTFGLCSHPDDVDIKFVLPRLDWVEGEQVEGLVRIAPRKGFGASGVRLELVRTEYVPRGLGNTHTVTEAKVDLAGGKDFRPGTATDLPFGVLIPKQGCPSRRTGRSVVTWVLRASVNRRLAKDFTCQQEIWVHNGRAPM
ncbi:MAG: hypothetical protein Kow00123_12590 [Anaerolineales bacterium]